MELGNARESVTSFLKFIVFTLKKFIIYRSAYINKKCAEKIILNSLLLKGKEGK